MRASLLPVFAFLFSCAAGSETFVAVDLSTDYEPLVEFTEVRVSIRQDDSIVTTDIRVPAERQDYAPSRIAQFDGMGPGSYEVEVALLNGTRIIASRRYQLVNEVSYILVASIDASCDGVQCPRGGDAPNATECQNATCVPPTCLTPEECGAVACDSDDDCGESPVACSELICVVGACRAVDVQGGCAENEYCDSDRGCRPRSDQPAQCGQPCDYPGGACEAGVYDCSRGNPVCVSAGPRDAGVSCRPSSGPCDAEDRCNGVDLSCPDEKMPETMICRPSLGECDVAEVCDGTGNLCPTDQGRPVGTLCTGGFCNESRVCSSTCTPGASCMPDGQPCRTGAIDCTSGTPTCVVTGNAPDNSACGVPSEGSWSSCMGFSNMCDESGTRTRTVTTYACQGGTCTSSSGPDMEACTRNTTNTACTTSCNSTGTCQSASCTPPSEMCNGSDDNCNGQCDEGCRIGINRYWSDGAMAHYYGPAGAPAPAGYHLEQANYFYLYANPGDRLVAFRQCIKQSGKRFYTTNPSCEGNAFERILGYGVEWQFSVGWWCEAARPLYRLYASSTENHFYATTEAERDFAVSIGYTYEAVGIYVWAAPN